MQIAQFHLMFVENRRFADSENVPDEQFGGAYSQLRQIHWAAVAASRDVPDLTESTANVSCFLPDNLVFIQQLIGAFSKLIHASPVPGSHLVVGHFAKRKQQRTVGERQALETLSFTWGRASRLESHPGNVATNLQT